MNCLANDEHEDNPFGIDLDVQICLLLFVCITTWVQREAINRVLTKNTSSILESF